jgi:hypothetical protein
MRHVVGLSGGKDSTAMALELAEREPLDYEYIITPTRNESPVMVEHWANLERLLGKPLTVVTPEHLTLESVIESENAIPNWRMRFCTKMLKIDPTVVWIKENQTKNNPIRMYVGLRVDEDTREGIIDDQIDSDFPMRRWGWGIGEVYACLKRFQIIIPKRTDCEWCFFQRLTEWYVLWRDRPESYWRASAIEERRGHTFRSPGRDTWPAALNLLAVEFEKVKRGERKMRNLYKEERCRVCTL